MIEDRSCLEDHESLWSEPVCLEAVSKDLRGELGLVVEGRISTVTNVGTHRRPAFDPCQECDARGVMEGRLCGTVTEGEQSGLVGCRVIAAYRLTFDPSESFVSTGRPRDSGGVAGLPCEDRRCVELSSEAAGSCPNPWPVGGGSVEVPDPAGTPLPSADVVT